MFSTDKDKHSRLFSWLQKLFLVKNNAIKSKYLYVDLGHLLEKEISVTTP